MTWSMSQDDDRPDIRRQVEDSSGQRLARCYQCGKCTAGCPCASSMDYPPHQIMRALQLGMRDAVLHSRAIWLCAACETCTTRCPQGVDVVAVMDALRRIAYAAHIRTPEKDVPIFHRIFMGSVRQHGRIFEITMMGLYNAFSGHLLKDVGMAPRMLLKGKLGLLPPRVEGGRSLRAMFERARALEAEVE